MINAQNEYKKILMEISRRLLVVESFLTGGASTIYFRTDIEAMCLQIRKILELIAFGSLVANKEIFSSQHKEFSKYRKASKMISDMGKINPEFYPIPKYKRPSLKDGYDSELYTPPESEYLTKKTFLKIYKKCDAVLHNDNPYGSISNYDYYKDNIPIWTTMIFTLLNSHSIKLVNDEKMYIFQLRPMGEEPTFNVLAPIEGSEEP